MKQNNLKRIAYSAIICLIIVFNGQVVLAQQINLCSAYVALCREARDAKVKQQAIEELTMALDYWKKFVSLAMEQNINPLWMNRVLDVDWIKLTDDAKADVEIARNCVVK